MASTGQFELLRSQVRQACQAWAQSKYAGTRSGLATMMAACDRATTSWDLLQVLAGNVAADRLSQEDLGNKGPGADPARLRMLALHQDLLASEKSFSGLAPAQKQVVDALRQVTAAQVGLIRRNAEKIRKALGPEEEKNPDLRSLVG